MARKYDLISELYNRTCKAVVSSPENWQAFLTSACRNYKLRFDEQLLVFAQRPDDTALTAEINGVFYSPKPRTHPPFLKSSVGISHSEDG